MSKFKKKKENEKDKEKRGKITIRSDITSSSDLCYKKERKNRLHSKNIKL